MNEPVAPGSLGLDGAEKTIVMRPPMKGGSPEEQLIPSPQLRPIFASSELGIWGLANQPIKKNRTASIFGEIARFLIFIVVW